MSKTCYIVAGPNGAGKSTFAQTFLPEVAECLNFINADLIASGLSPLQPDLAGVEAGRLLLQKMEQFIDRGASFGFETTLSGRGYARRIQAMKREGYQIILFYLKLPSAEMAIERVRARVIEGGHNVPEADVIRRFNRSWSNFVELYRPLADQWIVFDNSRVRPIILEQSNDGND